VAEVVFLFHTTKHPGSYKKADSTSVIFKTIFPDSEIAHKFSNAGTKTEAVIYTVTELYAILDLIHVFKNNSFLS
jgi:hypothetical protein